MQSYKNKSDEIKMQVFDVLVTPIVASKCVRGITYSKTSDVILSGQSYIRNADEDMSDFTIGFYKIIYKESLLKSNDPNAELLDDKGCLINKEYAGDTMYSFNTIANKYKTITDPSICQYYLDFYKRHYHCLANFWMIPMRHGRSSNKMNKYDSPDIYIGNLGQKWDDLSQEKYRVYRNRKVEKHYENYFRNIRNNGIDSIKDFCTAQYVGTGVEESLNRSEKTIEFYDNEEYVKIIDLALDAISARAGMIAENESICRELHRYFKQVKVL